jgi:LPXTG-site transpeptidase (sortase) family protein
MHRAFVVPERSTVSDHVVDSAPRTESRHPAAATPASRRRFVQAIAGTLLATIAPGVHAASARQAIFAPVDLVIPAITLEAEIEQVYIVDGVMQAPDDPWKVGWYSQLAFPGQGNNVVMAGHKDYWNVGPAVFQDLTSLEPGAPILLRNRQREELVYEVVSVESLSASTPPSEYTASDGGETLTLITCSGTFDGESYSDRLIVRAVLQH